MTAKEEDKITLSYRIAGIEENNQFPGFVLTYLEPVTDLNIPKKTPKVNMRAVNPKGFPVPDQILQQIEINMSDVFKKMQKEDDMDPRNIIHLESVIDFIPRNWKYGDIVEVTLKKVKDVSDRTPDEIENQTH